ncbi:hypothetical protein [Deinococcus humi]|uniref:Uncharacterized protein n=1 Tax=Deinococcus humi TaxID=662880 RepID=A0A7W8JVH4_9DEIO|nr:hypothetical protein [Deinococcus humi]MBB5364012.1 hypothetical protein [Deinococcus humi]
MLGPSVQNVLIGVAVLTAYLLVYKKVLKRDSWQEVGRAAAMIFAFLAVFLVLPELVPAWKPFLYWVADDLLDYIELVVVVLLLAVGLWSWLAPHLRRRAP